MSLNLRIIGVDGKMNMIVLVVGCNHMQMKVKNLSKILQS